MSNYYAHSKLGPHGVEFQTLIEHSENTAKRCGEFAGEFGAAEMGYATALMHDLGKCIPEVQQRITRQGFYNVKLDHSTAGVQIADQLHMQHAAYCIGGHHSGLPNKGDPLTAQPGDGTFLGKIRKQVGDYSAYKTVLPPIATPARPAWLKPPKNTKDLAGYMSDYFFIKMLFSCLTDADYLDTERFMDGNVRHPSTTTLDELIARLEVCTNEFDKHRKNLDKLRTKIRKATVAHYKDPKGIFTLTGPTGCGKTITSLDFALRHAREHGMKRVIYVIPYMSIISQTHKTYSRELGEKEVLAHYSNAAWQTSEDQNTESVKFARMASENWDSPVVITTAVQFFESLYKASPFKSRKLHNIANSVVVFDEAQMLPITFMDPCIAAMSRLVDDYKCSIVLCTATQPSLQPFFEKFLTNGYKATELCPEVYYTDPIFKRNYIKYDKYISRDGLVDKLTDEFQALCIVNTKQAAQDIFAKMHLQKGVYHLSKSMTEADIAKTIDTIRMRLRTKKRCVVISTCMIEAGVDADFQTVYKEMAGLDSIVQAAGRCNREGKRDPKKCIVHVFELAVPDSERKRYGLPPSLRLTKGATRNVWFDKNKHYRDPSEQEPVSRYFEAVSKMSETDEKHIIQMCSERKFRDVSDEFNLIEGATFTIVVPRKANLAQIEILRNGATEEKAEAFRHLGKYSVGVYQKQIDAYSAIDAIEPVADREDIFILKKKSYYSAKTGLLMDTDSKRTRGSY